MMIIAKSCKKPVGSRGITCVFFVMVCFIVSLTHAQEAYADKKMVSGTLKELPRLATTRIALANSKTKGFLDVNRSVLSSLDPDWNNARLFYIFYSEPSKDYDFKGYGVITHPDGDQTYIEFVSKITSSSGADASGEKKGFFIGGTGKFEGIRARWLLKTTGSMSKDMVGEWVVEHF